MKRLLTFRLGLVVLLGLLLVMGITSSFEVILAQETIRDVNSATSNDRSNGCASSSIPCAIIQSALDTADSGQVGDCAPPSNLCRMGQYATSHPAEVTISGPPIGIVNTAHTFTATVSPVTTTLPITYIWQATGQPPVTHTSGLSHTVSYTWNATGPKSIVVTATNQAGTVTNSHTITIVSGSAGPAVIESGPILNILPSTFLGDSASIPANDRMRQPPRLAPIKEILPTTGLSNTTAVSYIPSMALVMTDVVGAQAIDFIHNETAHVEAVAVGVETQNTVYEHDHAVCSRFHGYTVETIDPVLISGPSNEPAWFWHHSAHKEGLVEEVVTFAVFVDEDNKRFTVDSRWRWDDYQSVPLPDYDYVFNFQIWAQAMTDTINLVEQTLDNLIAFDGGSWSLDFANTTPPTAPSVFIQNSMQSGNDIHLTLYSRFTETVDIPIEGSWYSYTDRTTSILFSQTLSITPGVNAVTLTFPQLLDAVVYTNDGGFGDKVYVGSGFWFSFDDAGENWPTSAVTMTNTNCLAPSGFGAEALIIPGCAQMTGAISETTGYVGLGVTINPNGLPIDISHYAALTFRARGNGRSYRLKIETAAVTDGDFHEIVFTAPPEWRQFIIPLTAFRQRWADNPVPFTGSDVKALIWVAESPFPDPAVGLEIDQVAFFDSLVIGDIVGPASTNDVLGPYPITTTVTDDVGGISTTLYYSSDGGQTFNALPMSAVGGNEYVGQIPGQPMGMDINYYVKAADGEGNVATAPYDAPSMTDHFRVEWYPSQLVDDFFDVAPTNRLGGDSGITRKDGTASATYSNDTLCLDYDVTNLESYAVYYSLLKGLDATPYRSLFFKIKGMAGGEKVKVGLNDGHGHEPKLEISEHLLDGITMGWQAVRIPLIAFTKMITDWSQMHTFTVAFEEGIGSGQGAVCLDDIRFEPDAWPIRLDNFNDLDNQNGIGLLHSTDSVSDSNITPSYDQTDPYGGAGASLALAYNVPTDSYAAWQSGLNLDVSAYDQLVFAVRGANGGEAFHIWLVSGDDRSWVEVTDYDTITTDWTLIEIPLQDFANQGVDLTRLTLFKIAFEWTPMNGTIYLDDLHFTLPPAPMITALSPITATNAVSTTLVLTGTNFLMRPLVALGYNLLEDVTLVNSTRLTATIPAGIPPGRYDVRVVQPNMQSAVAKDTFTSIGVIYLPTILK